jgi:hypothetical protein
MNSHISKFDVFLYFANQLNRTRRRELEVACEKDDQVRKWFDELTPTEDELGNVPDDDLVANEIDCGDAGIAGSLWANYARAIAAGHYAAPPADVIPSGKVFVVDAGSLLYATPVPALGNANTPSVTPLEIPCVFADYAKDRLTIRQTLDAVPTGVVQLVVLRRIGPNQVETLYSQPIKLERTSRPGNGDYWYSEVALSSIGQINAGDDLIYCVDSKSKH